MAQFATSPDASSKWHRPVAVPSGKDGVYGTVKELLDDLQGWNVDKVDDDAMTIHVTKPNGFLGGSSKVTIVVSGPDGIPSSETNVSSESSALLSRDKANVATFCRMLWMRVT